jgi:uncharacterized membrane protein YgcG
MRPRVPTILLAVTGLLVAIAVGLVANAIASRSFTPGVDALPSAGSLAPPAVRKTARPAGTAKAAVTSAVKRKPKATATKPTAVAKPKATHVTTTPATTTTTAKASTSPKATTARATAAPVPATTDDKGGSRKGKGKGSGTSGSGGSSGSGKHGSDD